MIDFIKMWANQVIVAVIVATIFEMILPNGNNKKYIKMVIGIYVLFTLIQPITEKITGNKMNILNFNYEKYFDTDILETSSNNFDYNNSKLIENTYIDTIKKDIKSKLELREYELINCNINIVNNENSNDYGTIQSIELMIKKKEIKLEEKSNKIDVEKVEVQIENENKNIEKSDITKEEKIQIIEYLSQEYSVDKSKIIIN